MKNEHQPQPSTKGKRRKYTKEFKEESVRLAKQLDATRAASDLGINARMLRDWVRTLAADSSKAFKAMVIDPQKRTSPLVERAS